jgi:small-conductance mechanosensitive channel
MQTALTILLVFAAAWAVTRLSALVARRVLTSYDRRHHAPSGDLRAKIIAVKRRETSVAVIRTGIGYIAIAAALVLAAAQLTGGFDRLSAVAGASFFLIIVGFSAQRVLVDIIAGFNMFMERWCSVGDTIAIPMLEVQGVVEDVSLRRTKLRSLDGEVIQHPQLADRCSPRPAGGVYTDLLKERADKHLVVHGPVVLGVDEGATRSFARASAASRWGAG